MLIYWVLFLILACGALFAPFHEAGHRRPVFILFAVIPITLMIGLRWRIGPDFGSYVLIFERTKIFSLSMAMKHEDPAFFVLNWLAHRIGAELWQLNLFCAAVFMAGLTAFSLRQPSPWLSMLVALPYLVIVVAMSGVRQSLAIGLLFFALNAYERGRLYRCTAIIVVAAMFHASALLMGPICILSHGRKRLIALVLVFLLVIVWAFALQGSYNTYAARYSDASIQSSGVWFRLAMNAIPAFIFLKFQSRFGVADDERLLWRNVSLASLFAIVPAVFLPSTTAIDRFVLYLFPLQFFVLSRIPEILSTTAGDRNRLTSVVIAYAAAAQITFLTLGTFARFYVPYHSVLGDTEGLSIYMSKLIRH